MYKIIPVLNVGLGVGFLLCPFELVLHNMATEELHSNKLSHFIPHNSVSLFLQKFSNSNNHLACNFCFQNIGN